MVLNYPKLKLGRKTLLNFLIGITCMFLLVKFLYVAVWAAVIFVILSFLLGNFLFVLRRRKIYHEFLDKIGEPITDTEFLSSDYTMSTIPLDDRLFACSMRLADSQLMFGTHRHYRVLSFDMIQNIDIQYCAGHKIAKIWLYQDKCQTNSFCIPWSDLLGENVKLKAAYNKPFKQDF
jgi:hypothetical protein